jgi:hypothetical protein
MAIEVSKEPTPADPESGRTAQFRAAAVSVSQERDARMEL